MFDSALNASGVIAELCICEARELAEWKEWINLWNAAKLFEGRCYRENESEYYQRSRYYFP